MNVMSNIADSGDDPGVVASGSRQASAVDRLGRGLGWFSLGLGLLELLAPRRITRALGMPGKEGLVRFYGVREIGAGLLSLSVDEGAGLWSRVAGDGLDIATLAGGLRAGNPKRGTVGLALAMVVGITALDIIGAQGVSARRRRLAGPVRDYSDRSGFPQGLEAVREAAREVAGTRSGGAPKRRRPPAAG